MKRFTKDNKGVALISVMIILTISMLIATVVMEITYTSLLSRKVSTNTNKNFYVSESVISDVKTTLQNISFFAVNRTTSLGNASGNSFVSNASNILLSSSGSSHTNVEDATDDISNYFYSQFENETKAALGTAYDPSGNEIGGLAEYKAYIAAHPGDVANITFVRDPYKFTVTAISTSDTVGDEENNNITFSLDIKYENESGYLTSVATDLVLKDVTRRSSPLSHSIGSYSVFSGGGVSYASAGDDQHFEGFFQEGNIYSGTQLNTRTSAIIDDVKLTMNGTFAEFNGDVYIKNKGSLTLAGAEKEKIDISKRVIKNSDNTETKANLTIREYDDEDYAAFEALDASNMDLNTYAIIYDEGETIPDPEITKNDSAAEAGNVTIYEYKRKYTKESGSGAAYEHGYYREEAGKDKNGNNVTYRYQCNNKGYYIYRISKEMEVNVRGKIYIDNSSALNIGEGVNLLCQDIILTGDGKSFFGGTQGYNTDTTDELYAMFPFRTNHDYELASVTNVGNRYGLSSLGKDSSKPSGCIVYHPEQIENGAYLIKYSGSGFTFINSSDSSKVPGGKINAKINKDPDFGMRAKATVYSYDGKAITVDELLTHFINFDTMYFQDYNYIKQDYGKLVASSGNVNYENPVMVPIGPGKAVTTYTVEGLTSQAVYEKNISQSSTIPLGSVLPSDGPLKDASVTILTGSTNAVVHSDAGANMLTFALSRKYENTGNAFQLGSGGSTTGIFVAAESVVSFQSHGKGICTTYSIEKIRKMDNGKYAANVEAIANKLQYLCYLDNSVLNRAGNGSFWSEEAWPNAYAAGMPNSVIQGGFPSLLSDDSIASAAAEGTLTPANITSSYDFVSVQNWHVNVS